ncbi:MAG: type II toxin-antitoxin system HicB family antitoxin [Candidatus Ozemobacteraceae bacterium]
MNIQYPAIFKRQEPSGFFVRFPDLEEAITEGDTVEECLFNAAEVLSVILECRLEDGKEIPIPSKVKGAHMIAPDAKVQAALLVRFSKNGKSLADIARALGTSWPAAQRLENPKHSPTLRQLERAAAALGKRLILSFE